MADTLEPLNVERVSHNKFLQRVTKRASIDGGVDFHPDDVSLIYQAVIAEIVSSMKNHEAVVLRNFGKFYPKIHKGHPINFSKTKDSIGDRIVIKFLPVRSLMNEIQPKKI